MRTIDAFWDTRSLGIPCMELEFEPGDGKGEVDQALADCGDYGYVAAKVPAGEVAVARRLQEEGFSFAEASVELAIDLSEVAVPRIVGRLEQSVSSRQVSGEEAEGVLSQVREGMFDTDRVYLDPLFESGLAARRYVNWIQDELGCGASLHAVSYKCDDVGFYVYKERVPGVEAYPFLAGLYNDWKASGLGTNVVVLEPLREAQRRGCRRIRTSVSSNNLPILRAHELLGYRVSAMTYVFVRHAAADQAADANGR